MYKINFSCYSTPDDFIIIIAVIKNKWVNIQLCQDSKLPACTSYKRTPDMKIVSKLPYYGNK